MHSHRFLPLLLVSTLVATAIGQEPKVGDRLARKGDEIIVCGQLIHTTTPVVTWMDPGGYDAYRVERRFAPAEESAVEKAKAKTDPPRTTTRFGLRRGNLSPEQVERVRGGGWDLPLLQQTVDQFVIHYDACGTSRKCFEVLQDERGLSVQFMLDIDGTIYQTLDLKEAAWHATKANGRSIGIEIANIGAFSPGGIDSPRVARWYKADASLIKLTAALCKTFPKLRCDYPRDAQGKLLPAKLADDAYNQYNGILGHYHVQTNKIDPGPAFQWDRLIEGSRTLMAR